MSEEIKGELILPKKPQLQILHRQSILDFGVISNSQKKSLSFSLKNCGEELLEAKLSATEQWIKVNPPSINLNKGEIAEIEVVAEPKDVELGKHTMDIQIESNDLLEKTKSIYTLAHVQEYAIPIELNPSSIKLEEISPTKNMSVKVEVINKSDPSEQASVEVEIDPKNASWLTYEIKGHKNQLYINFNINPKKLDTGNYETKIRVRELFSPYSSPLELPLSFAIPSEELKIKDQLKAPQTKEKIGEFIKNLIFEEKKEEDSDILYTDQKTYSFKPSAIIAGGFLLLIIIGIIIMICIKLL